MFAAHTHELRLALLSLFTVGIEVVSPAACAAVISKAAAAASSAPKELAEAPGRDATSARLGAARVLNSLCAACGACERGRDSLAAELMEPAP